MHAHAPTAGLRGRCVVPPCDVVALRGANSMPARWMVHCSQLLVRNMRGDGCMPASFLTVLVFCQVTLALTMRSALYFQV